jgi:hypothetical protein
MMILIAGPYRSGTGDDPAKLAANVELALPLIELAGSARVGDGPVFPGLDQVSGP